MPRWTEEERRRGAERRDPYGDERRYRSEREEEGWRGRGWRDDDRAYGARLGAYRYGGSEYPSTVPGGDPHGWRPEPGFGRRREDERGPLERLRERMREGVRKLTGRGPKGYRRSDERILDDVAERMARSWIDLEHVEVRVERAVVTLTGFVARREDKRDLEDLADDVYGVEEVRNELRVRRGEQPAIGPTPGAGTGTTGTGAVMSARQQGSSLGQHRDEPGRR